MGSRRKRVLGTIALALVSLFLAFAIPEVLLRLFGAYFSRNVFGEAEDHMKGIGGLFAETQRYEVEHGIVQPPNFLRPSDLLWSLVPGYDHEITRLPPIDRAKPTFRVKVNALGFRGPLPSKRKDVFRVLCLGDSITFGDKLDEEDSFPAVLERLLQARWPDADVEVLNAGVPGYSSLQGVALWEKLRKYDPAVVVVAFGVNDLWDSEVRDSENLVVDGTFLERARAVLRRSRLYQAMRAVLLRLGAGSEASREARAAPPGRRVTSLETGRNILRILREAEAQGAIPIAANLVMGNREMSTTLSESAMKAGAPILDAPAVFERARRRHQAEIAKALGLAGRCPEPERAGPGFVFRVRLRKEQRTEGEVLAVVTGAPGKKDETIPLNDEGKGCDERAGDGVYSGLLAGGTARRFDFRFAQRRPEGGIVDEFHGFPLIWRSADAGRGPDGGPSVGPVEDYNEFYLMSEQIHPNADGARLIAQSLADLITRLFDGSGRAPRPSSERESQ